MEAIILRLEQLHYFEILAQEGSFNKAAALLHIAQPTLTASIKSMENELDKTLLIRDSKGITLTDDGKKVLKFSQAISFLYQNLLSELNSTSQPPSGTMSIIASKFFCELVLQHFVRVFYNQYPQIKVRLIENEFHASPAQLASTSCKFAVVTRIVAEQEEQCVPGVLVSDEAFYDKRYHYLPLFTDTFGFCFSKNSPLSNMTTVYPRTIAKGEYPSTVFPFGQTYITEDILLSTSNRELHKEAMVKENAYCNIPYFVYQHYFAQEEALTYRSYSNHMTITYYLIYPVDYTLTAAEQIFIEELQSYLTQMKFK